MNNQEICVTVYRVTGKQLFFRVNPTYCRECDLTMGAVDKAVSELKEDIRVRVDTKAWLNNLLPALLRGAYHPPAVLVENKIVSQGIVPRVEEVKRALLEAREKKIVSSSRSSRGTKPKGEQNLEANDVAGDSNPTG